MHAVRGYINVRGTHLISEITNIFYTHENYPLYGIHVHRSAAAKIADVLQTIPHPHKLADFFKSIEDSISKGDFKVGLEAR